MWYHNNEQISVHMVWLYIIWCVTIVQIWYHTKSGACSFKNDRVMPILVKFGLVWFGMVWFGLNFPRGFYDCSMRSYEVCIRFWYCEVTSIFWGHLHIVSSPPYPSYANFSNILFGLLWFGYSLVWYSSASFGLVWLCLIWYGSA